MIVISLNKYDRANVQLEELTKTLDHIEVRGYTSLEEFKIACEQTILKFERILIFSNVFESTEDIVDLNTFLLQNYNQVERICICTNIKDGKKLQADFYGLEDLVLVLNTASVTVMKAILHKSIPELKRTLSSKCIENIVEETQDKKEETVIKDKTVKKAKEVKGETQEQPKKKSLFGAIFGKKATSTTQNNVESSTSTNSIPTQEQSENKIEEEEKVENQDVKPKATKNKKSLFGGKKPKKGVDGTKRIAPEEEQTEIRQEEEIEKAEDINLIRVDVIDDETINNIEDDEDISALIEDELEEEVIEENIEEVSPEEDLISGIDFNDIGDEYTDVTTINTTVQQPQVKIVEKIVEVPIEKKQGKKGVGAYYNSVVLGQRRLPIIITGDRRSGKTHTALTLAALMQKDMKVLFVDFDTERKGSLFYLGLDDILDAPEQVKHGIVLSRENKDLQRKVWYATKGDFACLLSMITQDNVTDEQKYNLSKLLATQNDYGAIIIDCPLENLKYLQEVLYEARILICTETDLTACYNTLLGLDNLDITGFLKSKIYNNSVYTIKGDIKASESFDANMKYYEYILGTNEDDMNWAKLRNVGPESNILNYIKQIV